MLKASHKKYLLKFKQASGTSRGVLNHKEVWFLTITNKANTKTGTGECGLIRGLSHDDKPDFEDKLDWLCTNINTKRNILFEALENHPSIKFGLETAFMDYESENKNIIFPSAFTEKEAPIKTNGLIWMGTPQFMQQQVDEKLKAGFSCIKLKIGAIDFEQELNLLKYIRKQSAQIGIRVDANGAFNTNEALEKLKEITKYQIHSIEQPIKQGQINFMKQICKDTPIPIALDEELIGIHHESEMHKLLEHIQPQYIILKPGLLGGFKQCEKWIETANQLNINWWITSALESNVGLSAIAQWTFTLNNKMPQGLGTGQLYTNNIPSPLHIKGENLYFRSKNNNKTI